MKKSILVFLPVLFSFFLLAQIYTPVDDGSRVHFTIENFGIATGGDFKGLSGTIKFDPKNLPMADFDVSVDANTIDTDIESRDSHLKKEEYFDVKNHPKLSFKSTKITSTNKSQYLYMYGNITIKGVTKKVQFAFKATPQNGGYLFEGGF